jgi:hypothetical protein
MQLLYFDAGTNGSPGAMLVLAGSPMRQTRSLTPHMLAAPRMRFLFVALIACATSIALQGQTEVRTPALDLSVPAILPADPVPAFGAPIDAPYPVKPTTGLGGAAIDFGQPRFQPFGLSKGSDDSSPKWSRSMLDPFQPGPNFGKFAAGASTSNRFGGSGRRGISSGENSAFSASPLALPSFNALMHTNRGQALSPSLGTFKLPYRELFKPGRDSGDPALFPGSTLFSSSDLGNGVFFSAGTGSGSRPVAGAPAASLGNGTAAGQKHPSPLVNLKLSF